MDECSKVYRITIDHESDIAFDIKVPDREISLPEIVPLMHQISDMLVSVATKNSKNPVQCGPGCGVCCNQLVPLSLPEVLFMVEKLLSLPHKTKCEYFSRFNSNEEILNSRGLIEQLQSINHITDDKNVAKTYFELKMPCPFLIDESCSIHKWRPVVCREFNSLSDPGMCIDPFLNSIQTLKFAKRPSSVLAKLSFKLAGTPNELIPMPLLFDRFEKYKNIKQTWPADIVIEKLMYIVFEK